MGKGFITSFSMNMIITETVNTSNIFTSSDLALVTTISLFYSNYKIDKSNPHKVLFLFQRNKNLETLIEKYYRRQLSIEPRQFFDQLKAIKVQIYSNN